MDDFDLLDSLLRELDIASEQSGRNRIRMQMWNRDGAFEDRPQNCVLVRLSRHGTDFAGDSRSYWPRVRGMREVQFANDADDLGDLHLKVRRELLPLVASSSRRRHVANDGGR